ncbi:hypothetical protein [Roseibacillus ishigakijimensis]|uniref:Uncharacterized protein n=1 Tax=Roseibacillus ishigakijimensis TaxID=454146 RepID=A0A934RTY7_9BACT|nr:hypothetical protein [Roseibacillus ishigakijimensis]MBK1835378.1 hypothetical protein [Roseibacillus ishigakijimensis]
MPNEIASLETAVSSEILKPRYLRDKGAVAMFGIGRTKLYMLAKQGKIKSITLQEEGTARGTRLFCVESIERYIASFDKTATHPTD